jgi:2-dehydro-3-deoxyphosphogluconate aldolase/(4S)-4-hydroxy-2-oxoglutarate aldolase
VNVFEENKIIAVLVVDNVADAVPLAETLLEGGITALELTLRTPAAMESLRVIRKHIPVMTAGVGTILTRDQVKDARAADAAFGVAPGLNRTVVDEAQKVSLPFAPGVVTPSEVEAALENDCRVMKFFPAEPSGGLTYLESIAAPYRHLGVRFIPLGGISQDNLRSWLGSSAVCSVGGSWIAPRSLVKENNWAEIRRRAEAASAVAQSLSTGE